MDRFVWFVLLVVMSHLVTEFTRVTGNARGARSAAMVNDSMIQAKQVQNMVLLPGQDYALYQQSLNQHGGGSTQQSNAQLTTGDSSSYSNSNSNSNSNNNNNNNSNQQGFIFSLRPLIDSIFEIPISTLRAVNSLVSRLTGNYQHQASSNNAPSLVANSQARAASPTAGAGATSLAAAAAAAASTATLPTKVIKRSLLREQSA